MKALIIKTDLGYWTGGMFGAIEDAVYGVENCPERAHNAVSAETMKEVHARMMAKFEANTIYNFERRARLHEMARRYEEATGGSFIWPGHVSQKMAILAILVEVEVEESVALAHS